MMSKIRWSKLRASPYSVAVRMMGDSTIFHKALFRLKEEAIAPPYLPDAESLGDVWVAKVNASLLYLMEQDDQVVSIEIAYYRLET